MNKDSNEFYNQQGYAIFENGLDQGLLHRVRAALKSMLIARLTSLDVAFNEDDELDQLLQNLVAYDPALIREIIIAFRDHSLWYEILLDSNLQKIAKQLLSCEELMIVHDSCMLRIDPKDDEKRLLNWHQEYPYILQANPGLTLWIPLFDVASDMGPLLFIPKSHDEPIALEVKESNQVISSISPIPDEYINHDKVIAPEVAAGSIVAMHGLTLHKSGLNQNKNRARWVLVLRYSDMFDPELINIGWDVSRDKRNAVSLLKDRYNHLIRKSTL
ncbi:phytanoyl-CoA dioxygenase family protein [Pseudoalteromonas luteoviolacea]|uniref:Phytanoyl-CoA dioxygenase n=1 Tax=Pseudoalteromonas luteoviolacea S4060-1 TaxID=1365257 RepID=A0A167PGU0_9GAMM|nr:phytanoyl-CoA dioxygenase family protein [Pseudoalteromonas luteoviolacea]KZN70564.1 hypothetical protein N478_01250 [Pseudoalteromonas luteoviolacea S4060-1]